MSRYQYPAEQVADGNLRQLAVKLPSGAAIMEYQVEMIGSNSISGLLPIKHLKTNGRSCFYYDVSGLTSLSEYLKLQKLDVRGAVEILMVVSDTIGQLGKYLLEENCLLLENDSVFVEPSRKAIKLAYLPVERTGGEESVFVGFVVGLMKCIQLEDSTGKLFCRKILEEIRKTGFSYGDFNNFLLDILCFSKGGEQTSYCAVAASASAPADAAGGQSASRQPPEPAKARSGQDLRYIAIAAAIAAAYFAGAALLRRGGFESGAARNAAFFVAIAAEIYALRHFVAGKLAYLRSEGADMPAGDGAGAGAAQAAAPPIKPKKEAKREARREAKKELIKQNGALKKPLSRESGGKSGKKLEFERSVDAAQKMVAANQASDKKREMREKINLDLWEKSVSDPAAAATLQPAAAFGEQGEARPRGGSGGVGSVGGNDGSFGNFGEAAAVVGSDAGDIGCAGYADGQAVALAAGAERADDFAGGVAQAHPAAAVSIGSGAGDIGCAGYADGQAGAFAAGAESRHAAGAERAGGFAGGVAQAHPAAAVSIGSDAGDIGCAGYADGQAGAFAAGAESRHAAGAERAGGFAGGMAQAQQAAAEAQFGAAAAAWPAAEHVGTAPSMDATEFLAAAKRVDAKLLMKDGSNEYGVILRDDEFTIGRNKKVSDLALESKAVGRLHAKLVKDSQAWRVVDMNSKNGTYVNNIRLESGSGKAISNFDMITVANVDMVFLLRAQ